MSTNPNEGHTPDQNNPYGSYGGYQAPSGQQSYDPNDPYADHSSYTGYDQQQQQSGYGQQQQQQTYYQPPASAARRQRETFTSTTASSMNLSPNMAALFSYALGWVTGLIFFFLERKNTFVRFCAAQSFILFGGISIVQLIIQLIVHIPILGTILLAPILGLLSTVITVLGIVAWIFLMVQAYRGNKVKLPIVGDYAEAMLARFTRHS